jgi:hypothetical protein
MEKNNTDPFPYQELLPELKQLILSIGAQTATIPDAINHFKNLRATSKQFNTQQATSVFLDALLAEYPNQEIRIAKLLKTPAAYQWLNGVRAKKGLPAYQEKNTNAADVRSIHTAVYQGYTNEVKKWLEQGFDPNDILSLVIDQSPSNKAVELLTLLIAYGADVNKQFTSRRGSKTISLLYQVTRTKNLQKKSDAITRYTDIIAYLVSEGARLNPGEQELLAK